MLSIGGADRSAFLQRQTTNDIRRLGAGQLQLSVLTNPAARILDVLILWVEEGDELSALTLPGQGQATTAYLKSRIFFMDKVTVTDQSNRFEQLDLVGPEIAPALQRLGINDLPSQDHRSVVEIVGTPTRLLGASSAFRLGMRLVVPAESVARVWAALEQAGFAALSAEQHEILRIEAGLPAAHHELTEEYTPLEAGLAAAVSDSKGCYTGQEVLARQVTYDKVTQQLCGLRLAAPASPGSRLWAEGKAAGMLTSAAISPRFGPVGLGIVKRPYATPHTRLQVGEPGEASATATVSPLPLG
jgi:folate-binding protein YgfZ